MKPRPRCSSPPCLGKTCASTPPSPWKPHALCCTRALCCLTAGNVRSAPLAMKTPSCSSTGAATSTPLRWAQRRSVRRRSTKYWRSPRKVCLDQAIAEWQATPGGGWWCRGEQPQCAVLLRHRPQAPSGVCATCESPRVSGASFLSSFSVYRQRMRTRLVCPRPAPRLRSLGAALSCLPCVAFLLPFKWNKRRVN